MTTIVSVLRCSRSRGTNLKVPSKKFFDRLPIPIELVISILCIAKRENKKSYEWHSWDRKCHNSRWLVVLSDLANERRMLSQGAHNTGQWFPNAQTALIYIVNINTPFLRSSIWFNLIYFLNDMRTTQLSHPLHDQFNVHLIVILIILNECFIIITSFVLQLYANNFFIDMSSNVRSIGAFRWPGQSSERTPSPQGTAQPTLSWVVACHRLQTWYMTHQQVAVCFEHATHSHLVSTCMSKVNAYPMRIGGMYLQQHYIMLADD